MADITKLSVGREAYYTRELATDHNSTCLGTASPRAVPGFDVVLRPTKGVSILYGLGDPATGRAVLAAHHAGVAEAVAYL
ncbi:MAG TPA: relaxase domain-containing protein, partial [Actinomycetes bacterium]